MDDLMSGLKALESRLGYILHRCLKKPLEWSLLNKRQWMRETKRGWEGARRLAGGSPALILISGFDLKAGVELPVNLNASEKF
ncbi:hypothetical protein MUK42_34929 [Musa troglodytarum]|uniref:Uncharacterized protein n=1 Tax=Musa troglodytarum TaxID=320322 RepID=A0A9E7GCZ1_9LILI|nr:hypothetical protein MUK42_34929 [Musa troglodytarum]URE10017.1 hypothetical protein MUK42_34929 [Musa troglodytarum]